MSSEELQQEEVEVLHSIYDGDENFKQLSPTVFQYKVEGAEGSKSFLLEISWPEKYPNVRPHFNVDTFYNNHLTTEVKKGIAGALSEQAELELGTPMTYTLFEWAKENAAKLTEKQPENVQPSPESAEDGQQSQEANTSPKKETKQPRLSKSQKRKMAGRLLPSGELPRGYDWVDVVKHLSQTGSATT